MRLSLLVLVALLAVSRANAGEDPLAAYPAHVLFSVSHPKMAITETKALCFVATVKEQAPLRLRIVPSMDHTGCVSLESVTDSGYFLRHQDSRLKLHPYAENDWVFANDSSFFLEHNKDGSVSFRSYNNPQKYITVTASNELDIDTDPELPSRSFTLGD